MEPPAFLGEPLNPIYPNPWAVRITRDGVVLPANRYRHLDFGTGSWGSGILEPFLPSGIVAGVVEVMHSTKASNRIGSHGKESFRTACCRRVPGPIIMLTTPTPPLSVCFSLNSRLMHRAFSGCMHKPRSISIRMSSSSRSRSSSGRIKATRLGAEAAAGGGRAAPQGGVDELVERAEEAASGASDTFEAPRCSKGMAKALRKPTKALAIAIGFRRDEMLIHSDVGGLSRACREAKCAAVCVAAEGVDEGLDDLAGFAREQRRAEGKFPGPCLVMSRASTVRGIAMAASAGANIHPARHACFSPHPSKHHLEHAFLIQTTIVHIGAF